MKPKVEQIFINLMTLFGNSLSDQSFAIRLYFIIILPNQPFVKTQSHSYAFFRHTCMKGHHIVLFVKYKKP